MIVESNTVCITSEYFSHIVTKSKLALLAAQQANKSGDEVLRQGVATLFGKLGAREDGRMMS